MRVAAKDLQPGDRIGPDHQEVVAKVETGKLGMVVRVQTESGRELPMFATRELDAERPAR